MVEYALRNASEIPKHQTFGLIIAPTRYSKIPENNIFRELAKQIQNVFTKLLECLQKFSLLLLIGGSNLKNDIESFQNNGGNFIIATPGKLREALDAKIENFSLKTLEVFIMGTCKEICVHF